MRASGPDVPALSAAVFVPARRPGGLAPRTAVLGDVLDPHGRTIDRGLALYFPAPHSYTGEDVLELHVHGSPAVARDTLLALLAGGARLAEPGEFTRRAFLAGKLDLSAAEAVADLIAAEHSAGARAAAARLTGALEGHVEALRARLDDVLERLAAALDFPDEVEEPAPADLRRDFDAIEAAVAELLAGWERGRLVREGAAVAIVGPPNAGKSSLLNALLGEERAIVSAIAGTTRDTIEERLALEDRSGLAQVVRAIDTAGIRRAADAIEAAGVARSRGALESARLALVVVDGSRALDADAREILSATRGRARVVFFNKADLGDAGFREREADEAGALHGSVLDRASVEAVRRALAAALEEDAAFDATRPHLGTARQADAALAAVRALDRARATLAAGDPVDLVAGDLADARAALGALIGRDATDSLLDGIFARFCIGK